MKFSVPQEVKRQFEKHKKRNERYETLTSEVLIEGQLF
ncbi:hypothetical protein JOE21_003063 [Desmospora profundinema]|uniref:Uncharacterized protein n=1 Tax=Desmospora profundinema TaxID=1571184 RepID=A0ABU1IQF9_9BACL|nr:hypothetical protein [Desmospora profundinema]